MMFDIMLNGSSCLLSYEAFLSDVLRQTEEANDDGTRDDNFREVGVILVFAEHNSILLHVLIFMHFFTSIQEDCIKRKERIGNLHVLIFSISVRTAVLICCRVVCSSFGCILLTKTYQI
jgi:hypothetical protein